MISYLTDNFFVEPYVSKSVDCQYFKNINNNTFLLLQLEDPSLYQIAEATFAAISGEGDFSFKNYIKKFLENLEHQNFSEKKFSAVHFCDTTELSYITVNMPPILVGGLNGTFKELRISEDNNVSSESFSIHTYPSANIVNILIYNNDSFPGHVKHLISTFFSKKELLDYINENKTEETLNDLNFVFVNTSINKYVKYTIHEQIGSSLASIGTFEEKFSQTLDSFSDNIIYNTNASLVFSELILNAFEHGILNISPEHKQKMILEDTFDEYVAKAEKETEKEIDVSISFYDDKILKVTIDDHGEGFDYYKYMSKLTNVSDNTFRGRGLIMSLNICTALFYSDKGNRVSFYIRYKDEASVEEFNLDEEAYLRSLSVLYVEDDEFIRSSLAHMLKRDVKTLYVAEDGEEGLEIFNDKKPSIVITDVEMPRMDGIDMTNAIKQVDPDVYIVITTGYSSEDFLMRAIDAGVDKFLVKPISIGQLRKVLKDIARHIFYRETATRQANVNLHNVSKELEELKAKNSYMEAMQKAANEKQKLIIKNDTEKLKDFDIDIYYKTTEILGGDIYGLYKVDDDRTVAYIIDSMGKGISASIVPLLSVAYINRHIDKLAAKGVYDFQKLIEDFTDYIKDYLLEEECVNISFVEINTEKKFIKKASFGMFPLLLHDKKANTVSQLRTENPPFVKRDSKELVITSHQLPENFSIFMFTDALANCEKFTFEGLIEMFKKGSKSHEFADQLSEHKEIENDSDKEDLTIIKISSKE